MTAHAYTKECALFLPGDGALLVFGVDRRLLAVFLCTILDHFVNQPGPNRLVQEAVKMVTSSHWLMQQTFIALCPSSNLECISITSRVVCVRTSVSETESLVGMNSFRFGVYFALVPIFCVCVYKSPIYALHVLLQQSDFLTFRLLWLLLLKCDKNKHWLHF